jgi:hypothetical protein
VSEGDLNFPDPRHLWMNPKASRSSSMWTVGGVDAETASRHFEVRHRQYHARYHVPGPRPTQKSDLNATLSAQERPRRVLGTPRRARDPDTFHRKAEPMQNSTENPTPIPPALQISHQMDQHSSRMMIRIGSPPGPEAAVRPMGTSAPAQLRLTTIEAQLTSVRWCAARAA